MPMIFVEGPPGLADDAKQKMVEALTTAADEADQVPDVRLWLREYAADHYGQDGVIGAPVRPIAILEAPELGSIDAKRKLVEGIIAALAEAYEALGEADHGRSTPLSSRELEVADLVAKGLTNREIAQRLIISTRTVESHVDHIKAKLGFGRRARIVAWALDRASDNGERASTNPRNYG
jgi:DNA-binding CsgD family transcriptional regulator